MCGIAGIYSKDNPVSTDYIRAPIEALRHRGPDDEGYLAVSLENGSIVELVGNDSKVPGKHIDDFYEKTNLFLGHRRLSIIDISQAGHQPMHDPERCLWITYNGEIYNYLELKDELKALGHSFQTRTDTEVILAAYKEWGPSCIKKFNGMWAFAIFDMRCKRIFGSRDRFGVKPLYYHARQGVFAFASEIKALLVLPQYEKAVNNEAVYDYLVRGVEEEGQESFFTGIRELLPSHNFEYDCMTGQLFIEKYYELMFNDSWEELNPDKYREYTDDVRQLVFNSIRLRLRSDVAIGTCLSGGIDSSSIVCVINELMKQQAIEQVGTEQRVFTASYDRHEIDESRWAEIVVDSTKTSWHKTFPHADDLINDLEELVRLQDIPFGSTSIYAQYRVMKIARESGIKVLIDGQGGDEVFTGYHAYYRALFIEMIRNGAFSIMKENISHLGNSPVSLKGLMLSVGKNYALQLLPDYLLMFLKRSLRPHPYLNRAFLEHHSGRNAGAAIPQTVNGTLHQFMTGNYLKTLLRYEDRNSMHFSIESRTPFADDICLIEYMFNIPSTYKMRNCWSKSLLRDSMTGILPEEIRKRRDKVGFSTPEKSWLYHSREQLKSLITRDLDGYVNVRQLLRDWDSLFQPDTQYMPLIWRIINLSLFLRINFN